MASTNQRRQYTGPRTHEGAPVFRSLTSEQHLERIVTSCLLWEDTFYENGVEIAERMLQTAANCDPQYVSDLAVRVRTEDGLRHAPLYLALSLIERRWDGAANTIEDVIQRADEIPELIAMYWKNGKRPLSAQLKKGLARAFRKFDRYQLAKYQRKDKQVTLRDAMFLVHPKPVTKDQAEWWKALADSTLQSADTWEANLSAGKDKKATFTRLLEQNKLGDLALLRNLRNMAEASVNMNLVLEALHRKTFRGVLPWQFISAAKYAPWAEPALDRAMLRAAETMNPVDGPTDIFVDVSGSMGGTISGRSEMTYADAAAGLAILMRELCPEARVFAFGTTSREVPARRGMALRDALNHATREVGYGTNIGQALQKHWDGEHRVIVLTDGQSHDRVPTPRKNQRAYMVNLAAYQHGVGHGPWVNIEGFSQNTLKFIQAHEANLAQ